MVHAMVICISALCVYDGYTILKTISAHFEMTRTSRVPSATAELLVLNMCPYILQRSSSKLPGLPWIWISMDISMDIMSAHLLIDY